MPEPTIVNICKHATFIRPSAEKPVYCVTCGRDMEVQYVMGPVVETPTFRIGTR